MDWKQPAAQIEAVVKSYRDSGWLKQTFSFGGFQKAYSSVISEIGLSEDDLFLMLVRDRYLGLTRTRADSQIVSRLSGKPDIVSAYAFLSFVLDRPEQSSLDHRLAIVNQLSGYGMWQTLPNLNGVTSDKMSPSKFQGRSQGVFAILEAMLQLISATKYKYYVYNHRWRLPEECWLASCGSIRELLKRAEKNLADIEACQATLPRITSYLHERCDEIQKVSREQAKKTTEYKEIDGDPQGQGYKPVSGRVQLLKECYANPAVDFIDELNLLLDDLGARKMFDDISLTAETNGRLTK